MRSKNLPKWPEPVKVGTVQKSLNLSRLTIEQKQILWSHLTTQHPKKARELLMLSQDPFVRALHEELDAGLCLEVQFIPAELRFLLPD